MQQNVDHIVWLLNDGNVTVVFFIKLKSFFELHIKANKIIIISLPTFLNLLNSLMIAK